MRRWLRRPPAPTAAGLSSCVISFFLFVPLYIGIRGEGGNCSAADSERHFLDQDGSGETRQRRMGWGGGPSLTNSLPNLPILNLHTYYFLTMYVATGGYS